jgi:hypothetical protein
LPTRNAAGNVTDVTLELGGKSPIVVHENAETIAVASVTNTGEECETELRPRCRGSVPSIGSRHPRAKLYILYSSSPSMALVDPADGPPRRPADDSGSASPTPGAESGDDPRSARSTHNV